MRNAFLALATVGILSWATQAQAAVVQKVKFKGSQVFAEFFGSSTIDCDGLGPGVATGELSVNGFLSGSTNITKTKGSPKSLAKGVNATVFLFNGCTDEFRVLEGGGAGIYRGPGRGLASASFDGEITVQDFGDGATFDLDIDVRVVGVGPIEAGGSKTHSRTVNTETGSVTITHTQVTSATRAGAATGTLSIDDQALATEFFNVTLSASSDSTLTIEK